MQYNKENTFMLRSVLVQWAYQVPIAGRKEAVDAARRLLLFLCSVCRLEGSTKYHSWYGLRNIGKVIGLTERRVYRAAQRLINEGHIEKITGVNKRTQWRVNVKQSDRYDFDMSMLNDSNRAEMSGTNDRYYSGSVNISKDKYIERKRVARSIVVSLSVLRTCYVDRAS